MRSDTNQVWVTSALTDEEARNALVLACSLKRALTSRRVAVIFSPKVEGKLREKFYYVFDLVFNVEDHRKIIGLELEDFAKLAVLVTLRDFEQVVYVSPNMFALKNADGVFDEHDKEKCGDFVLSQDGSLKMFLFKPNLRLYEELVKGLHQHKNGPVIDLSLFLRTWTKNQFGVKIDKLHEKFTQELQMGRMLLGNEKDISFVSLGKVDPLGNAKDLEKFGLIGKATLQHWQKIYNEDIHPLMTAENFLSYPKLKSVPRYIEEPIAIVGMSCRFPGSNNLEEFWNLLFAGEDGTSNPPPFRWLREQCSRNRPDCRKTNAGFLNVPVDDFDAKFFGVSPKEMAFMDPQHRLLHELVWEGLEDACINAHKLKGTPGSVFIGSWTNDYRDILAHSGNDEFYRTYMGNSIGAAAARISHLLELVGPSVATESGCSSAIVAVHLACRSLQRGESNMALACGVNLLLHPFDKDVMPMVISPDGHCKTFCEKADGFARAEGCGVLVLKRLSDAVRDNDNIWAMIRGSAMSQEGVSKSMGTPTVHCESMAMMGALSNARVRPEEVSYVETHGTGTVVGDPMEVAAIAKAYNSNLREEPLLIGSVKTNVGHTESCSGITGIIKVALSMHNEVIPAHRNFEKLNPAIDLDAVPAKFPLEPVQWKREQGKARIAGVSSFGITGTDAHMILEESPKNLTENAWKLASNFERPIQLLKLSAKSEEALDCLLGKYHEKISTSEEPLADIAYSSNVGRANFEQRAVIIAKTKEELVLNIKQQKILKGEALAEDVGKICFLFTGQGSQYPGMAKKLHETSPVFRMHFDLCENILRETYCIDIKHALWGTAGQEISRTIYSQTSIFCVEYALLKLWESWGIRPDYALGHSLGEFAAAVCAGILRVEDALKLVAERSCLIDQLPGGKMLVIKASKQEVSNLMHQSGKKLDYAAVNSAEQTVVAGDSDDILEFSKLCQNNGLKSIVLEATHAFHSKHMDPILDEYRKIASTIKKAGSRGNCEYISGMRGGHVPIAEVNAEYWVEHTREKVSFLDASKQAVELGCRVFIEIGPQPVLSALTMLNNDISLTCLPSLKKTEEEWVTILSSLGKLYVKGFTIDWEGFDQFYSRNKVRLPSYPFIGKKVWPDLMAVRGASIHPLLGSTIPNASSTKIFQCGINLNTHEYIKDHAIGENIIVPGAGYLEMCMAAGLATVENALDSLGKPTRPMKVEDLMIEAPLALQESKTVEVQTVVELNTSSESNDWNDMSVKIFHRTPTSWLSHAKATFSPLVSAEEQQISFDLNEFKRKLQKESNEENLVQILKKLSAVGLKFGPSFRRLERVWKAEQEATLLAKVGMLPQAEGQQSEYILHPTVLDAMIQAIMFSRLNSTTIKKKLFVPIKISKFVWLAANETEETYIYAYDTEDTSSKKKDDFFTTTCSALLLDGNGKVLAIMSGVELIDTTVKAIEAVLKQQTISMPDLWEEAWRANLGPTQFRVDLPLVNSGQFYTEEFRQELIQRYNILDDGLQNIHNSIKKLVYCHMLRALYELGWRPALSGSEGEFTRKSLTTELGIQQEHFKFFGFILQVLQEEGILKQGTKSDTWQVIRMPLNLEQITAELNSRGMEDIPVKLLFANVGLNLSQILTGKRSALQILFPDDPKAQSVGDFYEQYGTLFKIDKVVAHVAAAYFKNIKQQSTGKKFVLRILEIGAGTGIFTRNLLKVLEQFEIEFEYTFTDISPVFFPPAQKMFEKYKNSFHFKKFDIEGDPLDQGFLPGYYDFICASDVIHATKDVREALRNVKSLLKPMGTFNVQDQTGVSRAITYVFGLLEGFWRFSDKDLRPSHCSLSEEGWREALSSTGFRVDGIFSSLQNEHSYMIAVNSTDEKCNLGLSNKFWLIFHEESSLVSDFLLEKIPYSTNRQVLTVRRGEEFTFFESAFTVRTNVEEDFISMMRAMEGRHVEGIVYCWSLNCKVSISQEEILQPYFYLAKSIGHLKQAGCPRLLTLTNGVVPLEESRLDQFPVSTIWGFSKALQNEDISLNCRVIDFGGDEREQDKLMQVFHEIWNGNTENQVAYNGVTRFTPKFQILKKTKSDLKLTAGTDRFQLVLPETKSIQDLQFGTLEPYVLGEEEVEIQVKASALNFRDVFSVLKPSEQFKNVNAVGFDLAGVVKRVGFKVTKWNVGDEVFGVNVNGDALPSHVKLDQDDVLPVGDKMTLCDAATLPAVFATSYYCLIDMAKVTPKDTVLIHTASGGVGLSAIQLCQHVGAKIICTVGSKRKQNYLRSLGIQHIFHSRNTNYGKEILELTGGLGVDVVLNSLTSEGFKEATLMACAKGARFIEMSKLSIWQPEEVKVLRPDVDYKIVDVASVDGSEWRRLMNRIKALADQKVISPIPYVRFDGVNIREALQYMQKAKHIGKVVCVMPEVKQKNGQTVVETPMFNDKSSYLITGGLGGIGFVVCQWMVQKGAKYVLLAGRNSPKSATIEAISQLNSEHNAKVTAVQLDVSSFLQCKELIQIGIPKMGYPALRVVMHCAGTLHDGLIQNQDWPKLSSTFRTKVDGTLNLHELTKDSRMEHFVLFSSIAALFGSPGQSNHSAGNNFEDVFAHYRSSVGLPATTINWGQWGEVGVATEVDLPGINALSNLQGLAALEFALKSQRTQICATNITSAVLLRKLFPKIASYIDEGVWKSKGGDKSTTLSINSEEFWELYDSKGNDLGEKLQVLQFVLHKILQNILKLDETDVLRGNQDFQEMGVDSLMFVEIKNALQALLGDRVTVSASALRECNTMELLSTSLIKLIEGNEIMEEELSQPPTMEEVASLIREDCVLPEHIYAKPEQNSIAESDIHCVLLTGSTGILGPYLLKELCSLRQISSVICLIRPSKNQSGEGRLESVLKERGLRQEIDMSKVSFVTGDVSTAQLGMKPEVWAELSNKVDAILHCAAHVNHVQHYRKRQHKDRQREVNIQGMKNLLELSCSGSKLKHVFYTSTLVTATNVDDDGILSKEWPEIWSLDGQTTAAYPISKFVGELLLKKAVTERGIPAKAIRLPLLVGDSRNGRFVIDGNHFMLRYLFIMKTGLMPSVPIPMLMIPVDICAEMSVRLFLDERCRNDLINLTHSRPDTDQEFVRVAKKLGYDVDIVEQSEFSRKVRESSLEITPFAIFKEFYQNDEQILDLFTSVPALRQWMLEGGSGEGRFLYSKKILRLVPDFYEKLDTSMDCIYRDLLFAREQGWLQKYDLK